MNLNEAYKHLGLSPSASEDDVKSKFRKLSKTMHPDKSSAPDAEEKFKTITTAYNLIKNPPKRGMGGGNSQQEMYDFIHRNQQRVRQVRRIIIDHTITFKESVLGTKVKIQYDRNKVCDNCGGQGHYAEHNGCTTCKGSGRVVRQHGPMIMQMPCPDCEGANIKSCEECEELGSIKANMELTIRIPGGVSTGSTLNMRGAGDFAGSRGGQAVHADAFLNVKVTPEKGMQLIEHDVHSSISLNLLDALKGKSTTVATVLGDKKIKIPKKSLNGSVIDIPRAGVEKRGAHKVTININYPEDVKPLIEFLEKK